MHQVGVVTNFDDNQTEQAYFYLSKNLFQLSALPPIIWNQLQFLSAQVGVVTNLE